MPPADSQNERLKALIRAYRECPESQAQKRAQIGLEFMQEMTPFIEERIRHIERRRVANRDLGYYLDICEEALNQFMLELLKKDFYGYNETRALNQAIGKEKTVINWFRLKLAGRTSDLYKSFRRRQQREMSEVQVCENGEEASLYDQRAIDEYEQSLDLDDEQSATPTLAEVTAWIKSDQCAPEIAESLKSYSGITGRDITLRRLTGQKWREMGEELGVPMQTLSSHFRRKCKPHLIRFWQE